MKKAIAVFLAVLMMTMTISCASSGQAAGGNSEGQPASTAQEAAAAQETVQEAASTAQEAAVLETAPAAASTAQETAAAQEAAPAAASTAQEAAPVPEISAEKIEALFGEEGPLSDLFPEGTDTEEIIAAAREQMSLANRQFGKAVEEIVEKSESESPDFDEESLRKFAEMLLGQFFGGQTDGDDADELDFDSLDALIEAGTAVRESEKEYILEHNSGLLENGDVQIVATGIFHEDDYDQDEIRVLGVMFQNNYRMDEENQLWLVDSSEDVVLFTHEHDQEGTYPVKDAVFAEKGDNYLSSAKELLIETGESPDILEEDLEMNRVLVLFDLQQYLKEHPEIKGIEYEGEIRTAEELDQFLTVGLNELSDKYGYE